MSQATVRQRNEIPVQYTWNAESVFTTPQAWEEAAVKIQESLTRLGTFQNRLAEGPAVLVETFALLDDLYRQVGKILVYASISAAVDTADQAAARMRGRAYGVFGQLMATGSFIDPELLAVGQETIQKWMKEEPRLAIYAHYVFDLFRKQQHVRSAEVEELLGMLATPFNGTSTTATMLTDADFRFQPARTSTGQRASRHPGQPG